MNISTDGRKLTYRPEVNPIPGATAEMTNVDSAPVIVEGFGEVAPGETLRLIANQIGKDRIVWELDYGRPQRSDR